MNNIQEFLNGKKTYLSVLIGLAYLAGVWAGAFEFDERVFGAIGLTGLAFLRAGVTKAMATRFLVAGIACLSIIAASAAPGEPLKTNSVSFRWDPADPLELIDGYNLYYQTNLPTGMPVTNSAPGKTMHWTPVDTNGWKLLTTIPGNTNRVTVPRVVTPTAVFFVLTASNRVGESPFSNVAWIPAPPNHRDKEFTITAVE